MEGLGYSVLKVVEEGLTEEPLLDGYEGRGNIHSGGKIQAKLPKQLHAWHLQQTAERPVWPKQNEKTGGMDWDGV